MNIPQSLKDAVKKANVVGFSGSRSVVSPALYAIAPMVESPVFVGCAGGVDKAVRQLFPTARIFSVVGSSRGDFARRSIKFVSSLGAANGVLISFPSSPCPCGLSPSPSPSSCFCGLGSGSWASLAFAVGRGIPSYVFLASTPAPPWLSPLNNGWFCSHNKQLSLF